MGWRSHSATPAAWGFAGLTLGGGIGYLTRLHGLAIDRLRSMVDADVRFTDAYFAEIAPIASGVYVNFLDREGEARVREAYPEATYRRLAEVKASWDPENVLSRNQNIAPATGR